MSPRFSLTYFDPPLELGRHLTTLFHFVSEEPLTEDAHSGALGQFVIFARGDGEMIFDKYTQQVRGKAHLMSGFSNAPRFAMRGPWHCIGSTLTPLGWAALTGVPAKDHVDRFLPARELLTGSVDDFSEDLSNRYLSGELSPEAACMVLGEWIAAHLGTVPPQHEALIERTIKWLGRDLNPDLDMLFGSLNYSRRQAERLVERYFGFPPAALVRKYRAVRAAALLAKEDLTDAEEAAIAAAYYDQPHMIREIRQYCGYTPSRLGGESQPILTTLLQMHNFSRLQEFRAQS